MMTKNDVFLLLRFVVISILYTLRCVFFGVGSILTYYPVFVPLLIVYLVMLIISIKVSEKKAWKIRIASNLIFIILFSIETLYIICAMLNESDKGEAFFGIIIILMYSPMFILFIIWLFRDLKNYEKIQNR